MKAVERRWVGAPLVANRWALIPAQITEGEVWRHFWGDLGSADGPLLIRYDNGQLCKFKRKSK